MINSVYKKALPYSSTLLKADWMLELESAYNKYHFQLLRIVLLLAMLIPAAFFCNDIFRREFGFFWSYTPFLLILIITLLLLLISKKTIVCANLSLLTCIAGYLTASFSPVSQSVQQLFFFCFPLLAFQLKGRIRGLKWSLFFLTIVTLIFIINSAHPFSSWQLGFRRSDLLISLLIYIVLTLFNFFSERQHENYLIQMVKDFIFDESSGCPNRNMLFHSILEDKEYLFIICSIENYSDLHTIFGYTISNAIYKSFYNYLHTGKLHEARLFRLKSSELGILIDCNKDYQGKCSDILKEYYKLASKFNTKQENSEIRLNIKMGATMLTGKDLEFLSKANIALETSRIEHRGYSLYTGESRVRQDALINMQLYNILATNMEQNSFQVHYQPIVSAENESTVWYESLLRVKNSDGSLESPFKYLDIAEKTGMDISLSNLVVEQAANILIKTGKDVSINVFLKDIMRDEFIDKIEATLAKSRGSKGRLIIEILETYDLHQIEVITQFIHKVKELGCMVAIDDFGAGYANFSNLLKLPVDIVKIDGSLIRQIQHNKRASLLLDAILKFCEKSKICVTAEFVESAELAENLKQRGVKYLQGFHYGKPAPIH